MSTWLKLLQLELDSINESDIIEPNHPVGDDDRVVGDMSDIDKRLFTLGNLMERDAKQSHLDATYCNDSAKKVELIAKANEFIAKSSIIHDMMWVNIKEELGLWTGAAIGVRAGSKVVVRPPDEIPPIIRGFLEG